MKKQAGFTLIELVIVIIILGILAATAVPKFVDLQGDARASSMKGLKAALEGAATLTYSQAAIKGIEKEASDTTTLDVDTVYGYPAGSATGIEEAVELSSDDWTITHAAGVSTFTSFVASGSTATANCNVVYTQAADADNRPVIAATTTGC